MGARVLAAMSGGVDSSVAAALLLEQGYEVIGVTMQLWPKDLPIHHDGGCCSLSAVEDARRVARILGIPYYVLNFQDLFTREVIDPFTREYLRGRTPNPCIWCNDRVKFGALLEKARELDAQYVATGHYAQVAYDPQRGRYLLKKAVDGAKDQTYALYGLTQVQLAHVLFPLGGYTKEEVRAMARERGLPVASKGESQDICFIPDRDLKGFLERRAPGAARPGPIVNRKGERLGTHQGAIRYTVGQRKGLGIAAGEPLYVLEVDAARNRLVVGTREELYGHALEVEALNWVAVPGLEGPVEAQAKIRYRAPEAPVLIEPLTADRARVRFREPQRAITPGQAIVFYQEDRVLGGGVIARPLPASHETPPVPATSEV
ncbi:MULTISPECIES: tRNA 2-thiouridine(34) synthase MnmA [Limnochorda]|uniref:tRNA 2-thiouridine(34) synthase MnmA n=1 Tax=Limnochorda TaxID=1676651 RepID=UPI001DF5CB97|nr:tRNA 2-thiouridine(34) synthase MnmA [Limnochorda pilosa]MBO2487082.1 tRNA 2-thiouridine(34) synthase MnmA [Bacillota bacterium]MBO2519589.1 tRNA 2-thiouridine(34) synthase MnmA [Bacillota bacterium]